MAEASHSARLAQLVERKALNLVVVGSSPTVGVSNPGEYHVRLSTLRNCDAHACYDLVRWVQSYQCAITRPSRLWMTVAYHRSHFGSRYKPSCCENASLLTVVPRFDFPVHTHGPLPDTTRHGQCKIRPLQMVMRQNADNTLRCSQAPPHPSTDRAVHR